MTALEGASLTTQLARAGLRSCLLTSGYPDELRMAGVTTDVADLATGAA